MNKIDVLKYKDYPLSSEGVMFLQNMITLCSKLGFIGGSNYILDGCTESGGNVSAGTVVVAGEVMPFAGGAKSTYVVVNETKTTVQVYDEKYEDLYTERSLIFGGGSGQLEWASFPRISLPDMVSKLTSLGNSLSALQSNVEYMGQSFAGMSRDYASYKANGWNVLANKPQTFNPSAHTHDWAEIWNEPDFALSTHVHTFRTIAAGSMQMTVTTDDEQWTVPFSPACQWDNIMVFVTVRINPNYISNGAWNNNNDIIAVVTSFDRYGFKVALRRLSSGDKHIYLDYMVIIKS